ncbi:MAG: porphobilinogen synthase [Desulfovibrionaceae bacterium]|nr:porphobilinogen synthase [Desulfovibrionaceae bacterium]
MKALAANFHRGRRLRTSEAVRDLVRETAPLLREDLIMPYFVVEANDPNVRTSVPSMPGIYQLGLAALEQQVARYYDLGLKAVLLFGVPQSKDELATQAYARDGIVQRAVRRIKKRCPDLIVICDVCLCEYMSHGHCGLLDAQGDVQNDATLPLLTKVAVSHAQAGADMVAPSDMMDGRIQAIRQGLDVAGYLSLPIVSYAVKYASAYYGPFRDAAESAPAHGNRKSYQMDPGNAREALLEAKADLDEGCDALIVKPAGPYSDILWRVKEACNVPVWAYQVSGEYSLIRAAGLNGWICEEQVILESLQSLKRAGAATIISYFTEYLLEHKLVR